MLNLAGALSSLPYVAVSVSTVIAAGLLWNMLIDNPIQRAEARGGYVAIAELEAAKAQLAETKRQTEAAQEASDNFAETLRRQAQAASIKTAEQEKRNAEYQARLVALGRQCLLDDDDIRELSK